MDNKKEKQDQNSHEKETKSSDPKKILRKRAVHYLREYVTSEKKASILERHMVSGKRAGIIEKYVVAKTARKSLETKPREIRRKNLFNEEAASLNYNNVLIDENKKNN